MDSVMQITHDIVTRISDRENTDPTDLPPLYDTIDPESLQGLIESSRDDTSIAEFEYCGYVINLTGDGKIRISEEVKSEIAE